MTHKPIALLTLIFVAACPAWASGSTSNQSNVDDLKAMLFADHAEPGTRITERGKTADNGDCTLTLRLLDDGVSISVGTADRQVSFYASVSTQVSRNYEVVDSDENLLSIDQSLASGSGETKEHLFFMTEERPGDTVNVVSAEISNETSSPYARTDVSCSFGN